MNEHYLSTYLHNLLCVQHTGLGDMRSLYFPSFSLIWTVTPVQRLLSLSPTTTSQSNSCFLPG